MHISPPSKALITGASGQLGQALISGVPDGSRAVGLSRTDCDIADAHAVSAALEAHQPDVVINAAAYTAVDQAEQDSEAAYTANAHAVEILAQACRAQGLRLLHVSTDFVFDGQSSRPYPVDATPAPLGVYGASKLAGEQAFQAAGVDGLIMRTGWVYSHRGSNFFNTMLRLHGEREELSVVADQVGTPTRAESLSEALWAAAARPTLKGIYHWSDAGVCSWYDFAQAIGEDAVRAGVLERAARVRPIRTEDYPTPASRPAYSVLDKTRSWEDLDLSPQHWRDGLQQSLDAMKNL